MLVEELQGALGKLQANGWLSSRSKAHMLALKAVSKVPRTG